LLITPSDDIESATDNLRTTLLNSAMSTRATKSVERGVLGRSWSVDQSSSSSSSSSKQIFVPTPLPVNYCAMAVPGVRYTSPDAAALVCFCFCVSVVFEKIKLTFFYILNVDNVGAIVENSFACRDS
jgi:Zn-dependent M16 (insulinase) family peptidase